ncbi:hypothetical protein A3K73_05470 [Candidatus Pacearchaeota archaeon RBG_13_36_9]|nr:MAG: hypothetical protein A3K73_05470 [Candidatus Pacearchaeota archaeon RBG_13_36_9]
MKKNLICKSRTRTALAVSFSVFIYLSVTGLVSAVNVGISPATTTFEGVLRGGYSEKSVVVSADSEKPVLIDVEPRGEIAEWINYSFDNFTVSMGKPYSLKITANPPADVPNGNYTGFLRFMTAQLGEGVEGHAVSVVRTSLDLTITVEITDIEVKECMAYNFGVKSVEKGDDVVFNFEVLNRGNIKLKPRTVINIWDQDQLEILKSQEFSDKEILPTTRGNFSLRMDSKSLELGQYWADVSVIDCYNSQTLTFDILEPGALKAEGVLLGILTNKTAEVNTNVPIEVSFKNIGEKDVEAYFKGKVTLGDKIIQVLETDKMNVPVSSIEIFSLFFTPTEPGRYVISGRVFYSGKKTFESSTVLEVFSKRLAWKSLLLPLVYIALMLLIGFLFFKIRKEKKLYTDKLRQIKK